MQEQERTCDVPGGAGRPFRTVSAWLRDFGLLLRRWLEEPIGVAVPLFALLIVLCAPQMPDMFAGLIVVTRDGRFEIGWWRALGFALSSAFLGLSAWYWTRAALLAPGKIDDAARKANRRGVTAEGRVSLERSREWAPRIGLLFAGLIAAAPLLIGGTNAGRVWNDIPVIAAVLGVALVAVVFLLVCYRHRLGMGGGPRAHAWMWHLRTTAIIAAAPFGWPVALILLALSPLGAWVIAQRPGWLEENLHTPAAAVSALGLLIPPLVIALAAVRDLTLGLLSFAYGTVRALTRVIVHRDPLRMTAADLVGPSSMLGLAVLILWVFASPPAMEADQLYAIRTTGAKLARECRESVRGHDQGLLCRPSVEEAVVAWRQTRLAAGYPGGDPMPLVIVAAEGGASRAAAWLLSAMRLLDLETTGGFGRHLFAISGVSGGSLGAATYLQALRSYELPEGGLDWKHSRVKEGLRALAEGDLLAASIATYFLNDTLGRLLGPLWGAVDDRAVALERAFERHWAWEAALAIPEAQARAGVVSLRTGGSANLPHLLLNGTDASTGRRLITSTIRFDPGEDLFAASDDLLEIMGEDVPTATAVTNSARFPYISPAGRFNDGREDRQVLDGGYFENYGARTAAELSAKIAEISRARNMNLVPIVVVVSNDGDAARSLEQAEAQARDGERLPTLDEVTVTCSTGRPTAPMQLLPIRTARRRNEAGNSLAAEVAAPLLGLYATRGAHGQDALHILRRQQCSFRSMGASAHLIHLALPRPIPGKEAAPLNWVLNQRVSEFLLVNAPEVEFNKRQASFLRETLRFPRGSEGGETL